MDVRYQISGGVVSNSAATRNSIPPSGLKALRWDSDFFGLGQRD